MSNTLMSKTPITHGQTDTEVTLQVFFLPNWERNTKKIRRIPHSCANTSSTYLQNCILATLLNSFSPGNERRIKMRKSVGDTCISGFIKIKIIEMGETPPEFENNLDIKHVLCYVLIVSKRISVLNRIESLLYGIWILR